MKVTYYSQIEDARRAVEQLEHEYLRSWGWALTCNVPGSYWLWQRDFAPQDAERSKWWEDACASKPPLGNPSKPKPYGVITATAEMAMAITIRSLDTQPELGGLDEEEAGEART